MKGLKRYVALLAAGAMGLSLTACGGSGKGKEAEGGALTVSIWDNNQLAGITELTADFTEQTGIAVEVQVVPWDQYWTLLEAGAQGGTLPDVFWMHSNYSQKFMSNDMLLDLTDRVADSDTIGFWYNKTMFDEAGIAYPDESWTWDTLAETAAKLTKEDGSQYGFASPASYNQDGYYNLIYSMGGSVLNEDKTKSGWDLPETIKAMEWWHDNLVTKVMPTQQVMGETSSDVLFGSGKAAMVMQGSWMVAAFKDNEYVDANCDVAVLPKAQDGTRVSIYNGLGWAAAADGPRTEEAWKLLEFLGSEEAQKKQAELGVTMSAFKGTSDTWVNCAPEFHLQAFLDMSDNMVIRPYTRNTKVWEDYSQETMVKAYTGEMTMKEVCEEIARFMNEELEQ